MQGSPPETYPDSGTKADLQTTSTTMRHPASRLIVCATTSVVAAVAAVALAVGTASAHVDPDPLAMQAGTTGTVAFNIEHGCSGSPTTDIKFEIPDGVTGVKPVDKSGWTATYTGNTVEFKGGPLAADQQDHFDITLTAPTTAGEIHFPAIQTCQSGELDWIEIAADGAPEPEHPAPTLKITQGPPTSADLTPMEEGTDTTEAAVTATAPPSKDESSNTGAIVGIIIGAVVVLGGGGFLIARRRHT
jgi:periplasmic copper chaperone A